MDATPEQIEAIVSGALQIIGALALIAAGVPPAKATSPILWRGLRKLIDVGGGNVGKAKNKE